MSLICNKMAIFVNGEAEWEDNGRYNTDSGNMCNWEAPDQVLTHSFCGYGIEKYNC